MTEFYRILENDDGSVDVILMPPRVYSIKTEDGFIDHDVAVRVIRRMVPFDGMEAYIRYNYYALWEAAEVLFL